jgi:RimJ/RimL family protein N-acetyltransferase
MPPRAPGRANGREPVPALIVRTLLSPVLRLTELAPWRQSSASGSTLATFDAGGALVEIRPAEPRDAEALVELSRAVEGEEEGWLVGGPEWRDAGAARRYLRETRRRRDRAVLVADGAGDIVGRLSLTRGRHPATAHVAALAVLVARKRRRQGIGRALMEAAEAWARDIGVSKLELSVFAHNAAAIALYERLGYRREGLRHRHLRRRDEFLNVVLMGKDLSTETDNAGGARRSGSASAADES